MDKFLVISRALITLTTSAGVLRIDAESFDDCVKQVMPLYCNCTEYAEVPSHFDIVSDIKVQNLTTGECKYYCLEDY